MPASHSVFLPLLGRKGCGEWMEEGTSVAELIRRAVERMAGERPKMSAQQRARRAIEIAGKFRSGKKDVSRKHDDYLAEAYG
jgi:hypothetical protein